MFAILVYFMEFYCTVLPAVFVLGGLFVPLCICFIRGFDGVPGGSGSWYSVRALLAGVLSQAEVEVHANSGLC